MEEEGEMDDNWFPFAVVTVKAEDEEIPKLSELHHIKTEDHIEPDAAARSSAAQMHSKLHSDGGDLFEIFTKMFYYRKLRKSGR